VRDLAGPRVGLQGNLDPAVLFGPREKLPAEAKPPESIWPRALAEAFLQQNAAPAVPSERAPAPSAPSTPRVAPTGTDLQKLRAEISHLELLVKKLQTELQIERQYNQALELHMRALTQVD
jgi:hypothetical protein